MSLSKTELTLDYEHVNFLSCLLLFFSSNWAKINIFSVRMVKRQTRINIETMAGLFFAKNLATEAYGILKTKNSVRVKSSKYDTCIALHMRFYQEPPISIIV